MGDMNEVLFLPELLRRLQERAPNIVLTVQHLPPSETIRALEASAIDFAVSALIKHSKSVHSLELAKDRMVCVMRKDHPAATGPLDARLPRPTAPCIVQSAETCGSSRRRS
jgi:DNA-binding transcriptional LysR family regulator